METAQQLKQQQKLLTFWEQQGSETMIKKVKKKISKLKYTIEVNKKRIEDKAQFVKDFGGQEIKPTHKVLQDGEEETIFEGSKRECMAYINNQDLITLYIKEINE